MSEFFEAVGMAVTILAAVLFVARLAGVMKIRVSVSEEAEDE